MVALGVLAAFAICLACTLVFFAIGGIFYSFTLGVVHAPVVAVAIAVCRWIWWRDTTSWTLVGAMVVTQVVLAVLAYLDSPSVLCDLWSLSCAHRH